MSQEYPLLSAIMIVENPDNDILAQHIEHFNRQTYPYKELIIVNNAKTQSQASRTVIDAAPNVFLVDTPNSLPAGQAKNYAISAANGQILSQYDYDSWHHPNRLTTQIKALAASSSHICVLSDALRYSEHSKKFSKWNNIKNAILHSMVFIRPADIDYPAINKAEEIGFINRLVDSNYKIISINEPELLCKIYRSNIENVDLDFVSRCIESQEYLI